MELGCSTLTFRKFDLDTALKKISSLGLKIIDIGMLRSFCPHFDPLLNKDYKGLAKKVKSVGLEVATLNVYAGHFNDPSTRETQINFVKACLEVANILGCYAICVGCGKSATEKEWEESAKLTKESIEEVAAYGKKLGVEICVEVHINTLVSTVEEIIKFSQMINDIENVRFTLDTSHIMAAGVQPFTIVPRLKGKIGHVHLRDAKNKKDKNILLTPGEGEVNFKEFLQELKNIGYKRPCILELELLKCEEKTIDQIATEVIKAKNYIEKIM